MNPTEQSRMGMGSIANKTQNEDKRNKKHNTKNYKDEQHWPHQINGVNTCANAKQSLFLLR